MRSLALGHGPFVSFFNLVLRELPLRCAFSLKKTIPIYMHRRENPWWVSLGSEFLTLNPQSTQVGDQLVGVKTSELEEKATAAHMISTYAAEIKGGGFFPYVEQVQAHHLIMRTETRSREGVAGDVASFVGDGRLTFDTQT